MKKRRQASGQTGLELRADGIACATTHYDAENETPRLHRCHFTPFADAEPSQRLAELRESEQLDQRHCISVAPTGSFDLLLVESPEVEASELKAAIRWKIKELIDFHIDDAILDVFDIPGQQERGRTKMMYVAASRITTVQEHIDRLEGQEVNLEVIDIPELVLRNIAALLPEDQNGVATLFIGQHSGMLVITRQQTLYLSRHFELGLQYLKAALDSDEGEGEFVLDDEEPQMPRTLQDALDRIVLDLQRSLDYYESHFAMPPVAGIVMAPLEENIPGMLGYLGGNLGVPVRTLDLNALIECDEVLPDALQAQCLFAIGAALRKEEKTL